MCQWVLCKSLALFYQKIQKCLHKSADKTDYSYSYVLVLQLSFQIYIYIFFLNVPTPSTINHHNHLHILYTGVVHHVIAPKWCSNVTLWEQLSGLTGREVRKYERGCELGNKESDACSATPVMFFHMHIILLYLWGRILWDGGTDVRPFFKFNCICVNNSVCCYCDPDDAP